MRRRNVACLVLIAASLLNAQTAMHGQAAAPPASETPQTPDTARPLTFDAITIKPTNSGTTLTSQVVNGETIVSSRSMTKINPDGFIFSNIKVTALISTAYSIKDNFITGGPDWIGAIGYDIQAKVTSFDPPDAHRLTKDQRNRMLQSLLADRFKLAVHDETKEAPIYELTLAKGGTRLHVATPGDTYPNAPKSPDGNTHPGAISFVNMGHYSGLAVTASSIADFLTDVLQRPVVDKTGLTGKYDFALKYTPDTGGTAAATDAPSIFTALQEQLGLKLDSAKGPVKTLVIDHIEKPSEN